MVISKGNVAVVHCPHVIVAIYGNLTHILLENVAQMASKLIKESKEHICGEQLLYCL